MFHTSLPWDFVRGATVLSDCVIQNCFMKCGPASQTECRVWFRNPPTPLYVNKYIYLQLISEALTKTAKDNDLNLKEHPLRDFLQAFSNPCSLILAL